MTLLERLLAAIDADERGVLFTVVEGEGLGSKLLVLEDGEQHGEGRHDLLGYVVALSSAGVPVTAAHAHGAKLSGL